jgi:pyruvate/2-oxoglutarate dehydrogenase complex dihydrolipoamide dehydrogenase (E3) component
MLPGTVVYVNAGTQLGSVGSLADVASPAVWGAFVLLGVFPLLTKWLRDTLVRRRLYAPWAATKPKHFDRNLIVIGAGAGGLVSAYLAAAAKAKVTLVEAHRMGGDCLNTGCVPSKALIHSAHQAHQLRRADRYGLHSYSRTIHGSEGPISLTNTPDIDFAAVMQRVRSVVASVAPHDSTERYTALGVDVVQGHAQLRSPWEVEITRPDGSLQVLTTRSIVLATGAQPVVPDLPGLQAMGYLTSETLWDYLDTLSAPPGRLLVLGGGPVGCELAQALARLGSRVTLVEQAPRLLAREDEDVSALVAQSLRHDGVELLCGTRALRCDVRNGEKWLTVHSSDGERELPLDAMLCALGRTPRLQGMGLEALGLLSTAGLPTDETLQTLLPNIFAVGDVVGTHQYTHAAAHQAWYATVNALLGGLHHLRADYRALPTVTFTDPAVARVGLNLAQAQAQGIAVEVTRYALDDLDRALCDGEAQGFVQVLTAPGSDTILGVTIVGSHAGEMLPEWVLAMQHRLGLKKVLGTVHAYPTWSEANKHAAGAWQRNHAPQSLLRLAETWHRWLRGSP